jgi:hypothetical protein
VYCILSGDRLFVLSQSVIPVLKKKRAFEAATSKAPHHALPRRSILKPTGAFKIVGAISVCAIYVPQTTPADAGVVFLFSNALSFGI